MSLLDKAKERDKDKRTKSKFSEEEKELVLAWLEDEITVTQVMTAIKAPRNGAYVYSFLARGAKALYIKKK